MVFFNGKDYTMGADDFTDFYRVEHYVRGLAEDLRISNVNGFLIRPIKNCETRVWGKAASAIENAQTSAWGRALASG